MLSTLPDIPDGTVELNFENNNIISIPRLPASLKRLKCSGNKLKSLPDLPPELEHLDCGSNKLTSLPPLPDTLKTLICSENPITILPNLPPNLKVLGALGTRITYIPELPESLQRIGLEYTPLKEPFLTFHNNFISDRDFNNKEKKFIKVINSYYANKRAGRNLMSLTTTVGSSYPENVERHIGSMLSGKEGTIKEQQLQLKESASRIPGAPGVSRKRNRKRKAKKSRKSRKTSH